MPTLTVTPNPTTRPATLNADVAGLAPGTRINLHVDGTTILTGRVGLDGALHAGIAIGTTSSISNHTASVFDSTNKKALIGPITFAVVATATVPTVPLALSGVVGDTVVNLAWQAPTGGAPITGYRVYRNGTLAASPTGLTATITGLTNGTAYAFTVSAVNAAGEGPKTASVTLTPVGVIVVPPVTAIQPLLDSAAPGATITIPAGTYRESLRFAKPVTLVGQAGAIIDGRDTSGAMVRPTWAYITGNDVTIRGFKMQYAAGTNVQGSVENAFGVQRFVLEDCDIGFSYVNVNLTGAIDSIIRNCSIHDAKHLGLRISAPSPTVGRGQHNLIISNKLFHNDRTGEPDPGADGGNLKATGQDNLMLDGNESYDSGVGLWLDVSCANATYRNNRVHDNDTVGIHDETSTASKIYNNVAYRNGFGPWGSWGWGAGILIHTSKSAEVYGNTVAWNKTGISVVEEDRGDSPGVTGNYVHDNVVAETQMVAGQDRFGLFWAYSLPAGSTYQPIIYLPASNNRGLNNRFYYANPDGSSASENQYPRFIWNGYHTMATFQTVPGGTGSNYMTQADATAALTAAGLPLVP